MFVHIHILKMCLYWQLNTESYQQQYQKRLLKVMVTQQIILFLPI